MLKRTLLLCVAVVGVFVLGAPVRAQSDAEHIQRFDVAAQVQTDATVDIMETILYDFGGAKHHGIYRDIPVTYATSAGQVSIGIDSIHVVDDQGMPYQFTTGTSGSNLRIKIGDPSALVTGVKTYVISYRVSRAMGYFGSYDEFYWNTTGGGWTVPISEASAVITLPKTFPKDALQVSCYEGTAGSTQACNAMMLMVGTETQSVKFTATSPLAPGQQLTVALGFPKGLVAQPTRWESLMQTFKDNIVLGLPVVVFLCMVLLWFLKGRDPRGRGTIVPEYDSPDNLTPLQISALLREKISNDAISAEIIYLATNGHLKITRLQEKILFIPHTEYLLEKVKAANDCPMFDKLLFDGADGLFGTKDEVKLSSLKDSLYREVPSIKKSAMSSLVQGGFFERDPGTVRSVYMVIASIILIASLYLGDMFGMATFVASVTSCLLIAAFGVIMPRVTKTGAFMQERILGFKEYLSVAEKDRINFHDAPEKSPELFEKLLPFAMALGVETAWAKQFEGIYTSSPAWYNDSRGVAFNPVLFTTDLRSFSTGAASTLASAPRGGSGSMGGGFSGGGFGGGGGGSW